jgi:ubiquinone/menaquinone biosynthesis C-methylase UbiE
MADDSQTQVLRAIEGYDTHVGNGTRPIATFLANSPELEGIASPDAVVLDNACGTAIVAEEIIRRCRRENTALPRIYAADSKDMMTGLATAKLQNLDVGDRVTVHTTAGEQLEFADNTFTHSVTSCGFPFFEDADAGAREVFRTLRPGGVAVVTSAAQLAYVNAVIKPGHLAAKPNEPGFVDPTPPRWQDQAQMEKCLRDAGFENVTTTTHTAYYAGETREKLVETLLGLWWMVKPDWSADERARFEATVTELTAKTAVECTMWDGRPGIGFEMVFIVVIGRK